MGLRVVGAIRESKSTDTSTSPKNQEDKITAWADLHDATIVGVAADRDVSGKTVSPWDRPELGPWMAQPDKFDALVASRLDRVCRNASDFMNLIKWSKRTGVALVFVREGFDLTSRAGQMAATMLAVVAEYDWENIRENTLGGQRIAVQQGRWKGGVCPYGYRPIKDTRALPTGEVVTGWWLEKDPGTSEILYEIISRTLTGFEPISAIAEDLNERRVLSPADAHRVRSGNPTKGSPWRASTILNLLKSRSLLGEYRTRDNSTIRDNSTGLPVAKAEPLLSRSEWANLQSALDRISKRKLQHREGVSMLHDVAMCWCGLKHHHSLSHGYRYYRCSSYNGVQCGNYAVRAELLEYYVNKAFIDNWGSAPVVREEIVPGEDHTEEIASLEEQIANLAGNLGLVKPGSAAAQATLQALADREGALAALRSIPSRPDTVRLVPTSETYGDVWERLSDADRGQLLRDCEVQANVRVTERGADPEVAITWGRLEALHAALAAQEHAGQST